MHGNRLTPSAALLLAFYMGLPAAAQQAQSPQPQDQPPLVPAGPVGSVAPTPGTPPPSGAPDSPPTAPAAPATATPGAAAPGAATPPAAGTAAPKPAVPAAPAAPAGPPGAGPDRLDFQLKFTTERGGSAAGSAANLEYKREDYAVLSGDVELKYQDLDLKADELEIDLQTKTVIALGHVILDQGPRRLAGDSLTFNLESKTGTIRHATGQVAPDYHFTGDQVDKTGDDTYVIRDGVFTSCTQPVPDWSFRIREATVEVGGYAHVRGATMRAKTLPVLYTPYLLWPVKSDRSSGFLVPNIGYSQRRGAELGLAYFQTLGRSYDTTFHLDTYTKGFLGFGDEFRYAPTAGTKGNFIGYYVYDPEVKDWRWKIELNHTTNDLPRGMRAVVQYQDYSDFNFFQDFERDFDRNTLRFIESRAFVTGNWGPHLVNLLLNSRETFVNQQVDDTLVQRRLPELQYRLRSTQIAKTPFYLEVASSASYLNVSRPNSYQGTYGRFDLFPQVTLPVKTFPWLNLALTGGERLTWYGDTLNQAQTAFTGGSLTRALPFGSAQIVGPSLSRIFTGKLGNLGKFKHIIEPRFTYTYQGQVSDEDALATPRFDEIDSQFASNAGRVALDNRLLGKPNTETGVAREILLFEVARNYSFDNTRPLQSSGDALTTSNAGPLDTLLRFNPTEKISLTVTASYDTLFKGISATGLTGSYAFAGGNQVAATWFTRARPETGKSQSNQTRLSGAFNIPGWNVRLEGQINYDFEQQLLQYYQAVLNYTSQCYGLRLELRDSKTGALGALNDREIRFSLSLKNVGTFLDLNSRSTTIQP
jgi:LPS-assembly protein